MPTRFALFFASILASLILVSTASAATTHHWHGGDWDPNQSYEPTQPTPPTQPTYQPNWDSGAGDAPETPQIWNQTPPVGNPNPSTDHQQPWSSIPPLPVSKTPTVSGKTAMIRRN